MNGSDDQELHPDLVRYFENPRLVIEARAKLIDDDSHDPGDNIAGVIPSDLESLLAKDFPDDIWLIEGLVPINGTTILSALPGSFKTWLLLDIAKCVASGTSLFGEFKSKQTGVLIIDEENSERLLQQRFKKLGADPKLPIYYLSDIGIKIDQDTVTDIAEFCDALDLRLVTIDSLVRVHDANENDAKEMAGVFRLIKHLNSEGITVLLTHHNRKPGSGSSPAHEMRGSSDILAALDCHLALTRRDRNELVLTQTKVRLAEELPPLELSVVSDDETVEIKFVGSLKPSETKRELAKQAIMEMLVGHASLNQRELLAGLDNTEARVNARTLRAILATMVDGGLIVTSRGERNAINYKLADTPLETSE